MVIWIIGMPGAGKTVLGKALSNNLRKIYPNVVFIDGDIIRQLMGNDIGHTIEDRKKNSDRICKLCKLLDQQNIHVVCSILSIFHEAQNWNRKNYKQYFEVYIDVPMDVLMQRDQKELYSKVVKKEIFNVVGFDIPFTPPVKPDLIIKNDKQGLDFSFFSTKITSTVQRLLQETHEKNQDNITNNDCS